VNSTEVLLHLTVAITSTFRLRGAPEKQLLGYTAQRARLMAMPA